jgi:short-subunit dehydrogenase
MDCIRIPTASPRTAGLGAGLARVFAKAGYDIALVGRKAANLEPLAAEVGALGRKSLCVPRCAFSLAVPTAFSSVLYQLHKQ